MIIHCSRVPVQCFPCERLYWRVSLGDSGGFAPEAPAQKSALEFLSTLQR